jgi:hypothetical protein
VNAAGMLIVVLEMLGAAAGPGGERLLVCGAEGHAGKRAVVSVVLSWLLTVCLMR